ncbi:unnamed protein product [Prunus armeniaca]
MLTSHNFFFLFSFLFSQKIYFLQLLMKDYYFFLPNKSQENPKPHTTNGYRPVICPNTEINLKQQRINSWPSPHHLQQPNPNLLSQKQNMISTNPLELAQVVRVDREMG